MRWILYRTLTVARVQNKKLCNKILGEGNNYSVRSSFSSTRHLFTTIIALGMTFETRVRYKIKKKDLEEEGAPQIKRARLHGHTIICWKRSEVFIENQRLLSLPVSLPTFDRLLQRSFRRFVSILFNFCCKIESSLVFCYKQTCQKCESIER